MGGSEFRQDSKDQEPVVAFNPNASLTRSIKANHGSTREQVASPAGGSKTICS